MRRHTIVCFVWLAFFGVPATGHALTTEDIKPAVGTPIVYPLGSGDRVKITVFNVPQLSGEYGINPAGEVSLPLIGDVSAAGQTAPELSQAIRAKLADGFVNDPKVTIEVISYTPYYILGEVNKPGQFPFIANLTIEQAVAAAGGYTYRAARRKAFLRHPGRREQAIRIGDLPAYVQPGDTIRIGERYL